MYSLIATAKLNDVDPRAWRADVINRIADHPVKRLDELLPWNWREKRADDEIAAGSFVPRHSPDWILQNLSVRRMFPTRGTAFTQYRASIEAAQPRSGHCPSNSCRPSP
jgi:IS66 C-terminal element